MSETETSPNRPASRPVPNAGTMEIAAYVPGKSAVPAGVKLHKLSANETPLGPSQKARDARSLLQLLSDHMTTGDWPEVSDAAFQPLRERRSELETTYRTLVAACGLDAARAAAGAALVLALVESVILQRKGGQTANLDATTIAAARLRADGEQSFSSAQNTALKELELSKGVDTDAELQELLRIEQHYAANARVITTVDELLQTLMNI